MPKIESPFSFYSAVHEQVTKLKLLTNSEDFRAGVLSVLHELGWFKRELIPLDSDHQPGLGLTAHLEGVVFVARTDPQSLSLAINATNYGNVQNWSDLPDTLQHHFPARNIRILSDSKDYQGTK